MDTEVTAKKKFYKRWWFWGLIVIVALIIIGVSNTSSPHIVGQTQSGTEQQQAQTIFKVGDRIQNGNTVLTVTKVNKKWQSSNQFDTPQNPGDVYVVVTVSIANIGSSALDLSGGWGFKLQDANGEQVNESFGGVGLNKLDSVSSLASGGTATGDVIFAVPSSATSNLTLIYQPLFSIGAPIQVQLQ